MEGAKGAAERPAQNAGAVRHGNRELIILKAIAEGLNASVDLSESLETALSQVADWLGLRTGWVWLLDDETGEPYLAAAQNLPPGLGDFPERMAGWCYCLETFRAGDLEGAANVNVVTCSRLKFLLEGTDGLRFHASVPLYAQSKKLGVLNVASVEWRRLSAEELRLLYTIGDMLGIAIERARLYSLSAEAGAAEERNRLAREIHDTLAQGLSAIALRLDAAEALLEEGEDHSRIERLVADALEITRSNLEEARRTVLDLRAAPLEGQTLSEALADLVEVREAEEGPDLRFESVGAARPLPVRVEVGLYRITQEAIANALRHAGASVVSVRLVAEPDRVALLVEDDGRGFQPAEVSGKRFGLIGMNERARLLGGEFSLESAPGAGTRLAVYIPLI